ncbi:MAG: CoA transferase [Flavobacteriales bacterium]|nr:CoA transferase [Flavobacteriales bacterium]
MLSHIRVLETAGILAGPSVGMFFAELGAQVTKVENQRTGGDATRRWKLPEEEPDSMVSAYFSSVNWGKEHVLLDLTTPAGRARFDDLVRSTDVLITNHLPDDAEKLGLQRDRLRTINPTLVHGHIRGYVASDRPAFDVVLQAESGYISMTGTGPEHPAKLPIAMIDVLAAHQLKEGLLLALWERDRDGIGAYVEVSLEEAALTGLINQASNYLMTGHVPGPLGTLHPNIAPYGELFHCADGGTLVLAVGSDAQFKALCDVLELPLLASDPRFLTNADRVAHRPALNSSLVPAISGRDLGALMHALMRAGVPAGEVRSMDTVMRTPVARRMTLESAIDGVPTRRISGNAFRIERDQG